MTGIDILVLIIIIVSAGVSLVRGIVSEAVSLIIWVLALIIATLYAFKFGSLFHAHIDDDMARGIVAWLFLFIGVLLIGGLISYLIRKLRPATDIGWVDRSLGIGFGLARGVLIVSLIALAAHLDFFTSLRESALWNDSTLQPYLTRIAKVIHSLLPGPVKGYFDFDNN